MASRTVTLDGKKYELSEKQQRALQEPHYSATEMFADLGSRAAQVFGALIAKGLFRAGNGAVRRTAIGTKVNKVLVNRSNGKGDFEK